VLIKTIDRDKINFVQKLHIRQNFVRTGSIQKYASRELFVTWATVEAGKRNGVEAYLSKRYAPLVGERRPAATPISVNSPWD
jgi:hypothetical protein